MSIVTVEASRVAARRGITSARRANRRQTGTKKTPKRNVRREKSGYRSGRAVGASDGGGADGGATGREERLALLRKTKRQCVAQRTPRISSVGRAVRKSRRSGGSLRNVSASSRIKSWRCASLSNGRTAKEDAARLPLGNEKAGLFERSSRSQKPSVTRRPSAAERSSSERLRR